MLRVRCAVCRLVFDLLLLLLTEIFASKKRNNDDDSELEALFDWIYQLTIYVCIKYIEL